MVFPDHVIYKERIKRLEERWWKQALEYVPDTPAFPLYSDITIKEKVRYDLILEWKRIRAWET